MPIPCTKCGKLPEDYVPVYGYDTNMEVIIVGWKCPKCFPSSDGASDPAVLSEQADLFVRSLARR